MIVRSFVYIAMIKMQYGKGCIRLLAIHYISVAKIILKDIEKIVQRHWITVQQWLKREGMQRGDGLYGPPPISGAPRKINKRRNI